MFNTHKAIAATAKGLYDEIQVPTETPGEGQVLLKAAYGAMIAFDTYVTDRGFYVQEYPVILGFSASGTIEKLGPGVDDLKLGDRVTAFTFGPSNRKALQEYSVQPRTVIAKIPDSLPLEEAATIPDNFVTAFYTLFSQLGLPIPLSFPAPESPPLASAPILVYGAGSTAGLYAVQLLRLAGYKKIIATASKKHHEYLRSLGATDTFDYRSPSVVEDIANAIGGDGKVLLALDCITADATLTLVAKVISSRGKVALLLPIKEGNTVTNEQQQTLYFELSEDKNPFPSTTEIIGVRTFFYEQDENLKNNLMPKILPELLRSGYIKPAPVLLQDKGTFKERVGTGLELLRENKVSVWYFTPEELQTRLDRTARLAHFDKILIANRGEIACRVIRTAKKLGIKTVAVYSEADRNSLHVQMADEAYCIGPAPSSESYLNMDRIIEVCHRSGAKAVHPGYGFLSENAIFSRRLGQEGIVFIGPPEGAIVSMGSKSESKNIMLSAGVPCVPGYHGDQQNPELLFAEAQKIGFPVLIKAIHGGGGKGMRTVSTPTVEDFNDALSSAKRESLKAFGNDTVLIEKYIETPRHVEVQVFADTLGNVISLWERDCSVQRRNQKIIEEAPAPGLSPELRADLGAKAVAAAKAVNYVGAGTVEFIFDNDTSQFYFMEMNTRLQVEHPVTEMITGLDLVEWQLEVAAGNPLPLAQDSIPMVGHAFEARIYAENPRNNFLPDSGTLHYLSTPTPTHIFAPSFPPVERSASSSVSPVSGLSESSGAALEIMPSLRIEQGFKQGAAIGVFYDPMIAKVVVHGRDRTEALRVLRKALDEYHIVGVSTNVEFLRTLAGNKAFIDEEVETGFIKKHFDELFPPMRAPSPEVFAKAALFIVLRDSNTQKTPASSPWTSLTSHRFGGDLYRRTIKIKTEDLESEVTVQVIQTSSDLYDVAVETTEGPVQFFSVTADLVDQNTLSATVNMDYSHTTIVSQPPPLAVPASQLANTMERLHVFDKGQKSTLVLPSPKWLLSMGSDMLSAKGALKAPMPSLIVELKVKVGDRVEKGQAVVVIESMKTETLLRADTAGVVKSVGCRNGEMVEEGRELVDIEADDL
ncbi:biotin/lipoyl attachment:Carbamoyl-phosphate synthase subunit L [Gymnopilus junonius]|uniref:Biotin/lipoyl attachment:Carbamoyl-phosphate synthase subunit L n=1 Tax=Gymnopilus junonius TaxID=109634 RepID=A0A9P5P2A9_GYMJU|nr:biotin/lipoyl attachment:Carbamoyl-phosphate synthase subunit L [Gymnopilus junonius]